MLPKRLRKGKSTYKIVKVYENFVLYENEKTGAKECFTKFQLGLLEEQIKPDRQANKGGAGKH